MTKVAILGATGFIGKKVVCKVLGEENEVRYLTRNDSHQILGAKTYIGDISSNENNLNLFLDKINLLINCSGEINKESLMRPTHVKGTANLLKILESSRSKLKQNFHWIQLSSCGAYGKLSSHPATPRYVDETTQENPIGEYECTKTEADNLIKEFAKKHDWFKYTIIRPTNVFGIGMRSTAIKRIAKMIKYRLFFYIGNRDSIANFVHVDDVVHAIMLSINQTKAYNQIFIVSNDCKFSDMVDTISDALGIAKSNWVINELLFRNILRLLNKFINFPIGDSHIDVMMRQTYYTNNKIIKILDFSSSDSVLAQLNKYISAVFNDKK